MHNIELFTIWIGLLTICTYPTEDVSESISWPGMLVILFFHQLEQRAIKCPVTMEHIGNSSFILLRSKSNSCKNFQSHHEFDLTEKIQVRNTFHIWSGLPSLNNCLKCIARGMLIIINTNSSSCWVNRMIKSYKIVFINWDPTIITFNKTIEKRFW